MEKRVKILWKKGFEINNALYSRRIKKDKESKLVEAIREERPKRSEEILLTRKLLIFINLYDA